MSKLKDFTKIFVSLYPEYETDKYDHAIKFTDQGSDYRIYVPNGTVASDGSMNLSVKIDHIKGGVPDDHASIIVTFDQNGQFPACSPPSVSFHYSDGTVIGDWAYEGTAALIGSVGTSISIAAGVGASFITSPVGGAVVGAASEVIVLAVEMVVTGALELTNSITKFINDFTDDGGELYFAELVSHTLNRLGTAALIYKLGPFTPAFQLSNDRFLQALGAGGDWDSNDGYAETYHFNGSHKYKSFKPTVTTSYGSQGMIVSLKLNAMDGDDTVGYAIITAGFNVNGKLCLVQVTAVVEDKKIRTGSLATAEENGEAKRYQQSSGGLVDITGCCESLASAAQMILYNQMQQVQLSSDGEIDFSSDQMNLTTGVQANIEALEAAVVPS